MAKKKVNYKKVYIDYFGYCKDEYIPCEHCKSPSIDIHHLTFKSQLGKDTIDNLMALCRDCHNRAHEMPDFNNYLKQVHEQAINRKAIT